LVTAIALLESKRVVLQTQNALSQNQQSESVTQHVESVMQKTLLQDTKNHFQPQEIEPMTQPVKGAHVMASRDHRKRPMGQYSQSGGDSPTRQSVFSNLFEQTRVHANPSPNAGRQTPPRPGADARRMLLARGKVASTPEG
jgi:hypothetical protein